MVPDDIVIADETNGIKPGKLHGCKERSNDLKYQENQKDVSPYQGDGSIRQWQA